MSVRAKFCVSRIESSVYRIWKPDTRTYESREMRTIVMHPVASDVPGSENKRFWDASPNGELKLGTINPEAWSQFELDRDYYLDFTPAPPAEETPAQ